MLHALQQEWAFRFGCEAHEAFHAQELVALRLPQKAEKEIERAGIKRQGWGYGQTALVTAVQHERNHDGTAHQYFMPSGPLAILPLPGGLPAGGC